MLQFASIHRFSGKRSIEDINHHIYAISSVWIDQKYVILQKHFSVFFLSICIFPFHLFGSLWLVIQDTCHTDLFYLLAWMTLQVFLISQWKCSVLHFPRLIFALASVQQLFLFLALLPQPEALTYKLPLTCVFPEKVRLFVKYTE